MYQSPGQTMIDSSLDTRDPEWIVDDNLLRDEGVFFGQTKAEKSHKVWAINALYVGKNAALKKQIDFIDQEIEYLETVQQAYDEKLSLLYTNQLALSKALPHNNHDFYNRLITTLVYIIILGTVFPTVLDWTSWRGSYAPFLAFGVYLFGSLSLFSSKSVVYFFNTTVAKESEREFYKIIIEQLLIPFVAATFLVIFGLESQGTVNALMLWLLLLFLFVFTGKGIMVAVYGLHKSYTQLLDNRRQRNTYKNLIKDKMALIEDLKRDYEEARVKKRSLAQEKLSRELQLNFNLNEAERKVALFESEYALAWQFSANDDEQVHFFQ